MEKGGKSSHLKGNSVCSFLLFSNVNAPSAISEKAVTYFTALPSFNLGGLCCIPDNWELENFRPSTPSTKYDGAPFKVRLSACELGAKIKWGLLPHALFFFLCLGAQLKVQLRVQMPNKINPFVRVSHVFFFYFWHCAP